MSVCKSLRLEMINTGQNPDETMSSFLDQYGIAKTEESLQIVQDIIQTELAEKAEYLILKERQTTNRQQQQRNDGAVGGGIRVTIDQRVHGEGGQTRVHQFHIGGGRGEQVGGENNGQPRVFVHRAGGGDLPGNLEGMPGGMQHFFAAAAAAATGNNAGQQQNQQGQQPNNDDRDRDDSDNIVNGNEDNNTDDDGGNGYGDAHQININMPGINDLLPDEDDNAEVHVVTIDVEVEGQQQGGIDVHADGDMLPQHEQRDHNRQNIDITGNAVNGDTREATTAQAEEATAPNLPGNMPQELQDILNGMQAQMHGEFPMEFIGNIMNVATQQQQPEHGTNEASATTNTEHQAAQSVHQAAHETAQQFAAAMAHHVAGGTNHDDDHQDAGDGTQVHVVEMPPIHIPIQGGVFGMGMPQQPPGNNGAMPFVFQRMAEMMERGQGGGIPFPFPPAAQEHWTNANLDDDDIPEID